MTSSFRLVLAGCAIVALVIPVHAGMMGGRLSWQYYAYGGPYTSAETFPVTGSAGGTFYPYFNIVADDTSITFDYSVATSSGTWSPSDLSLAPTIHNGIAINTVSGSPFLFLSVNLDPLTNMDGFDPTRFSFTDSQIQVDWQNLSWDTNTMVKLDVSTAPVPEPSALGLVCLALVGRAMGDTGQEAQMFELQHSSNDIPATFRRGLRYVYLPLRLSHVLHRNFVRLPRTIAAPLA